MKRFYREATAQPADGGWNVALDGKPIRTQGGQAQLIPQEGLARLMAAEWQDQGELIDVAAFPLRDMADYAIDSVAADRQAVIDKLLRYAETDTLCYRADPDEPLYRRQQEVWEPLLTDFEGREGVTMQRVSGVIHRPQNAETLAKLSTRLEGLDNFTLAALEQLASLSSSLSIGLSALAADADLEALWRAANLEEDWQIEQWGEDNESADRRARRWADFQKAKSFADAVRAA